MSGSDRIAAWRAVLAELAPEIELVDADAPHDPDEIEFALVWQYPPGALKRYRRLRLVSSLGAGIDHLLRDPEFPAGVPFVRLVDPTLTRGMVEYALWAVLRYHRQMVEYASFQAQAQWHPLPATHPFWRHPKVTLTPHVASLTDPRTAAPQVVANIRNSLADKPLANIVDRANGY